jgi:hypothetical protein
MYTCSLCGAWYTYTHVCNGGTTSSQWVLATQPTITATSTNSMIWQSWINQSYNHGTYYNIPALEHEADVQAQRFVEARHAKTRAIEKKAKDFLLSLLSDEQKETWEDTGYICEIAPSGRDYRIRTGGHWTGNVCLFDEKGQRLADLCCHTFGRMPKYDQFAAQLLAIRMNEEEFIGVANVHHWWVEDIPEWYKAMRARYRNARDMTYVFDGAAGGLVNVYYGSDQPQPTADMLAA